MSEPTVVIKEVPIIPIPKPWYKSRGVLGSLAGLVFSLVIVIIMSARYFDITKPVLDNVTNLTSSATQVLTAVLAFCTAAANIVSWIGRTFATQPIGNPNQ